MRQKLKIEEALSMKNGIKFYSKRHKGYLSIATVDKENNIITEWTTIEKIRKNKSKKEIQQERKETFHIAMVLLPFLTIFCVVLKWAMNKSSIYEMRTFLIGMPLLIFVLLIVVSKMDNKEALKFHAAEHMVLNAYRDLDRVPTIEEIYRYSRFSNTCGTNAVMQFSTMFILMFACTFIPNVLYRCIGFLFADVIAVVLTKYGLLNFFQRFVTMEPTEKELRVAIQGMTLWLEKEKEEI